VITLRDLCAQIANPYPYLLGNWPIVVGKLPKQPTTTVRCRRTVRPAQLNYEEPVAIGDQEKPCTGMYLIIDAPGLADLRRTMALEGFGVEDLNYAYWSPHPCCPEIARLQDILVLMKGENSFGYEVHHVRWAVEEGGVRTPDLHAMIVGRLDGPLPAHGLRPASRRKYE
jgi:hypothetical protein